MTSSDQEKNIEQLARAIERGYGSAGRAFWRGFLWGLGRGLGTLIGWLILLAILVYLIKISGLQNSFHELMNTAAKFSQGFNSLPR